MTHSRIRTAVALVVALFLSLNTIAAGQDTLPAASQKSAPSQAPEDWSKAMVDSTLTRYPDAAKFGGWGYAKSLYLFGQYLVYKRTHDPRYLEYMRQWVDAHIDENGVLDRKIDALDYILPANLLIILYDETGDARYKKAAEIFRHRFDDYPRTNDGGFWHATVP
ncbi:MAG: glycoside hydrolase family 88 protein, partial [Terriglobales bacterium]